MTEAGPSSVRSPVEGRRLLLHAEGSAEVGLGHVMRMLGLGQAWVDAGGRVEAIVAAPGGLVERYRREGFVVHVVNRGAGRAANDMLAELVRNDPSSFAVIDRPDLRLDDLLGLGDGAGRSLVVDDHARLAVYPVGLVLNQNGFADPMRYHGLPADRRLMGLRYALLRREFRDVSVRTVRTVARRLLVTFGGADPTGMTLRALHAIQAVADHTRQALEVRTIVGAANPAAAQIAAFAAEQASNAQITVEHATEDMVAAMTWADLGISGGGSTVWELARTGCPAIVVATSTGESELVDWLREADLFDGLGPQQELDTDRLLAAIDHALSDAPWRERMAIRGQRLVDGEGARRVVDALATLDAR